MTAEANGLGRQRRSVPQRFIAWISRAEGAGVRTLPGSQNLVVTVLGAAFSLFFLYGAVGIIPYHLFLGSYIGFTYVLIFLLYPASPRSPQHRVTVPDVILALATAATVAYFITQFEPMMQRAGIVTPTDFVFGVLAILVSLEGCRRVLGPILPMLAIAFLLYDYFGAYFPGELGHKGFSLSRMVGTAYSLEGVFGVVANVYATFVILFIIFGAFLEKSKVGDLFVDMAFALVGRTAGGPAKAAVVSSGLLGTIMGSGAANVVITGTFTIPMMKRAGFRPHFAGAVEATASLGGALMPPVMGAAAFVLAAFTETSYFEIVKISFIPAILYYFMIYCQVHFYSRKNGLRGMAREELPVLSQLIRGRWHLLLPLGVLIGLLVVRFSPYYAAFFSIVAAIGACALRRETRLGPREILDALVAGARNSLVVGATAGVMGVILTAVLLPGMALRFSSMVLSYSYGYLPLVLLLSAVAAYILGMGMTITADYILLSILAAPALVQLGVPLVTAHLAILWFTQTATISPPFCISAFIAAGIAGADPMRTGFTAMRLGSALILMPYLLVYTPILLTGTFFEVVSSILTSALALLSVAAVFEGYVFTTMTRWERLALLAAAPFLFVPGPITDLIGAVIVLLVGLSQWYRARRRAVAAGAPQAVR